MTGRDALEAALSATLRKLTLGQCWEVLVELNVPMSAYPPMMSFRERLYRELLKRCTA